MQRFKFIAKGPRNGQGGEILGRYMASPVKSYVVRFDDGKELAVYARQIEIVSK